MRWTIVFGLLACNEATKEDSSEGGTISVDNDNDGFALGEDCDDNNANVNPSADELCDGVDNNCDGSVDENVATVFYADSDDDGYGGDDDPYAQ